MILPFSCPTTSSQTDKYVAASRIRLRELETALKISKREMRRARKTIKTYEMVAALNGGRLGDVPPSSQPAAAAVAALTQADVSAAVAMALQQQQTAAAVAAAALLARSEVAPAAVVAMVGQDWLNCAALIFESPLKFHVCMVCACYSDSVPESNIAGACFSEGESPPVSMVTCHCF